MADIKSLKAAFDSMAQRVQADLANLRQQLAQAQSKSTLSADDQKTLDDLEQTAKALDPTDPTTLDASAQPTTATGTPPSRAIAPPTPAAPSAEPAKSDGPAPDPSNSTGIQGG